MPEIMNIGNNKTDGINEYSKSIHKTKLLTKEEEVELAKRIENNDKEARRIFIESNLRLAYKIAMDYVGRGIELEDLIGYANEGLIKAVDGFDYRYGTKFSTYATYKINGVIINMLPTDSRTIRVPFRTFEKLKKYIVKFNELSQKLVHTPSKDEIKEYLDLTEEEIAELFLISNDVLSYDKEYSEDESTILDIYASDINVEDEVINNISSKLIVEILNNMSCLSDEELRIIYLRSGIEDGYIHSKQSIANIFGVTREAIRRRLIRIYEKINKKKEARILKTFIDEYSKDRVILIDRKKELISREKMYEEIWTERYIKYNEYLTEYREEPLPTIKYKEYYIGSWALEQRVIKKYGIVLENGNILFEGKMLTAEHIKLLEEINFNWNYLIPDDTISRK